MWEIKFKRLKKVEVFKEPAVYVPQTKEHTRQSPVSITTSVGNVSDIFNKYCTEMGVQCTVSMDPTDFRKQLAMKNVSNRDVMVEYDYQKKILAPGEWFVFTIRGMEHVQLPIITLLPHGNVAEARAMQNAAGINRSHFTYGELSPSSAMGITDYWKPYV